MFRKGRHRRSPFRPKIQPPDVYFINTDQAAKALGISKVSLARWRAEWKANGTGPGPEPIYITPRIVKYRVDDCYNFGSTFLERMAEATSKVGTGTSTAVAVAAGCEQ
jgi:hypothetical protein